MRPFDGWLDDIRVFGDKTNAAGSLSLQQLEWLRNKDVQNLSEPTALLVSYNGPSVLLRWLAYPGGFHLESTREFTFGPMWTTVTNAVQSDGIQNSVTFSASDSSRFFRLVN